MKLLELIEAMNASLVHKLCCPIDKEDLDVRVFTQREDGDLVEIIEAMLTCRECGRYYPVIYGIPVMTPDKYRERALEDPLLKRWGVNLEERSRHSFVLEKKRESLPETPGATTPSDVDSTEPDNRE